MLRDLQTREATLTLLMVSIVHTYVTHYCYVYNRMHTEQKCTYVISIIHLTQAQVHLLAIKSVRKAKGWLSKMSTETVRHSVLSNTFPTYFTATFLLLRCGHSL
jgi:hypothetical protein